MKKERFLRPLELQEPTGSRSVLRCLRPFFWEHSCFSSFTYHSFLFQVPCFLLSLFILSLLLSCNAESNLKKGDLHYALGEYYDAAAEYKAAYAKTKTRERGKRGERALKMAECYRRINYTAKAVGHRHRGSRHSPHPGQ